MKRNLWCAILMVGMAMATQAQQPQFQANGYTSGGAAISDLIYIGHPVALIPARANLGGYSGEIMVWLTVAAPYTGNSCDVAPSGQAAPSLIGWGSGLCTGPYKSLPTVREHVDFSAAKNFVLSLDVQQQNSCVAIQSPKAAS